MHVGTLHVGIPIVSYITASGNCGTSVPKQKLNAWLTGDNVCNYIHRVACFEDVHEGGERRIQVSNQSLAAGLGANNGGCQSTCEAIVTRVRSGRVLEYIEEDIAQ